MGSRPVVPGKGAHFTHGGAAAQAVEGADVVQRNDAPKMADTSPPTRKSAT
jgi:hypothetical protein